MSLNGIMSSWRGALSPRQKLELAKFHLDNASKTEDHEVALVMCRTAESELKKATRWAPKNTDDQSLREAIVSSYSTLGKLQETLGQADRAQASRNKADQWRQVTKRFRSL